VRSLPSRWQGPDGAPVVVFANSLGARQGSWREQIERLGTRARALTFDLPGHARAEADPFTFDDIVDATARLLDEQGVRGALFCGVSLGGAVGVALAARRPELVGRLVAVNAPIRQASPAFWSARADAVERNGLDALADDLPARWFTAAADPDRVCETVAEFRTIPPAGYAQTCRALADIELAADAGRVRVPTVIVTGTADLAVPREHGDEYASVIAGAERVSVEGAPHLLPIERAEELSDVLTDGWA
jgi:3-oxoadipate enol-lactonase